MRRDATQRFRKSFGRNRRPARKSPGAGARRNSLRFQRLSIEYLEQRQVLAASYFAQAEPAGSVNVQLVPLANVAPGTQEIVTFGVPFTRDSVTQAELADVRVLKNGVEIPAFVEQLTPWRSIDDPSIDGQSVRVARIQIPYTFAALSPESVTVQWGGPARTLNRTTMQDPRIEWHTVTSGSFVASDNVQEPDVLPVLPAAYMSKGMLDSQTDPTNSAVAETRDDPAVTDAMTFTGYTEYDYAQKNFFYTIINQNPGISIDYKTQAEPWLYDRSSAMYELYMRSGFATALREAIRSTDYYVDHLDSSGFFTLSSDDPKYSYNESLAYTYWLLGDNRMLAPISTVVNAHSGTVTHWTPELNFWTERNVGYKLLANEMAYEVTGAAAFKNTVQTIVGDLVWHQNGAGGQLPANRIDGGLYHIGEQHDPTEVSDPNVIIASPWMSALVVDPMVRAYGVWQSPQIVDFIVRMGNFEKAASKTDANGQFGGVTRYPDYLMRADGTSESRNDTDVQHAMDVGGVAAWATYFAELRGTPDPSLRQLANDLYATYDVGVNFWTRPGGTNYNVSPPRRYSWEYKNSASFSWALSAVDQPNQPGTLQFNAANYTVNENQGTIAITVTRTGGSTGAVSVNYATADGTAKAGSDYTAASGTLTFADGETSKTFNVPITNDTLVENDETLTLSLSNPTGGASLASPATATLTIVSDDTTNQPITVALQQGVNGYTSTTDAEISTQYGQYNDGNGTTTVDGSQLGVFHLSGDSGYSTESLIRFGDLGITSNALVSSATLTLSVDTWDANPTIRGYYLQTPWTTIPGSDLSWLRTGLGPNWAAPGALGQGTDVVAGKSFVIPGITASGQQTITINLDPAIVQSWINNPNADQGIVLVNETPDAVVRINASENDTIALRPKLSITYTVGSQTPQPGSFAFSGATYSVNENGGAATITVTRSGGSSGAVSVHYATSNGTATAGSDYTATSGTLSFAAGETTKTFTIPITNDTLVEPNETVNLTLSSPTGGATLGSQSTAALTIISDDVAQPGTLQFSNATYTVNETAGTATITVTRTGGSSGAASVHYATSNGTATAGSDYTATSGTLSFADGETTKAFTIPITNDAIVEANETVNLTLSNPTGGATLGSQSTAALTIVSDDVAQPGTLQFSNATYTVNETAGRATITVTRTGGSSGSVSVHYATSNGTATAGSDYTATSGTLTFAAGETSKTFTIPVLNDTLVEPNETVNLTLSSPTGGATLGSQATAALTIVSDDTNSQPGTVTLQQGVNGYAGTTDLAISTLYTQYTSGNGTTFFDGTQTGVYQTTGAGSYSMETLIRFSDLGIPAGAAVTGATLTLTVDTWDANPTIRGYYVLAPWNSTPGSSSTQIGWLHRGGGQNWTVPGALGQGTDVVAGKNFVLPGITASGQQTITINLDPAVVQSWVNNPNADQGILLVNETPGAIVRVDTSENSVVSTRPKLSVAFTNGTTPPQPGSLQFSNAAYSVNENGGTATITVSRTGGSDGAVSVHYATSNGTATAGSDYTAASGTLNFAAGETTKTFTIPILNDTLVEPNETVNLTLSSPTGGATLGTQSTAALTIVSDDVAQPGKLQFNNATYSVSEAAGMATITVTRTVGSDGAVSVHYATSNGTATAGNDYTATSGTLNFAAGETTKAFTIPILNDTLVEGNETINLTLSNPAGGATLGGQATAVLTIQDDDAAGSLGALQFNASSYSLAENGGSLTVTVNRVGGSSGAVSVHYATSDGTATAGADYTATSGTLNFAAGETSKTFTVAVLDDAVVEAAETLNLTLSAPTGGATLGNPAAATFTIVDNDSPPPSGAFTNITAASGVGAIIDQKYQQTPDWWLSGEHLVDLNNDGFLDLYLSNHGGGSVVALNDGHGVFTRVPDGTFPDTEIHQMYDINEDGKVDLSMTFQDGGGQWWTNNSTPNSVNFTATNITRETNTSRSQVMMDFNGDGKVDWLRSAPPGLVVDFGNGAGGFAEDSLTIPIPGTSSNDNASFLPADFDGDGKIDLLVLTGGNYDGTPGKTALWHNNGNMTFTDVTASSGIPLNGVIAKGIGDFNQDGSTDFIAIENLSLPPAIYLNDGHGHFTKKAGAISGVPASNLDYSFWGTAVSTDFDNDGIADIIMDGKYFLEVLRGTGGGNFTYMNTAWGIRDAAAASLDDGLTFGDINGDGKLDIIGYDETFPTRTLNVYRNDLPAQNWLNVRPVGLAGDKGAAGAKISIYAAGTNQLLWYEQVATYDFQSAASYYSYGETERHFGLGNRAAVDVVVQFAGSDQVTRINNVAANQTIRVLESAGNALAAASVAQPSVAAVSSRLVSPGSAFSTISAGAAQTQARQLSKVVFPTTALTQQASAGNQSLADSDDANWRIRLDAKLFPDAESAEDPPERLFAIDGADDLAELIEGDSQFGGH